MNATEKKLTARDLVLGREYLVLVDDRSTTPEPCVLFARHLTPLFYDVEREDGRIVMVHLRDFVAECV